ncbi:SEC12-like protein 1 isoform X3 [Physcomitrium patens]|uniref:Anaphase-promoting complex subunit 4 WD40 domain-containing protein n=1 Tax=Physcomitrium patens TaxID=3218 RepID=A0A7I4AKZ4_PHYPA|nr:SEC12-like protein 1 isoform X3 [Physcomitrium patens]|eukprot:XP_024392589.1 SEC12-like protein 1 isoform X3 [Physcomitrella patens]
MCETMIYSISPEDGLPLRLAVHPSGDGVICFFANSCKFFEINPKGACKLKASERELPLLQGLGIQNCICFSGDGSLLATGGKDGHLRIFAWPSCEIALDESQSHRSIQDIDFSLDSGYLASTGEEGACRVWNIVELESLVRLEREKDEKFGYCRFSRDGTQAFLFVSITRGKRGYVGVWNMMDWSKLGLKKLADASISALAISRDGKSLGLGTIEGDVAVVLVRRMEVTQLIGSAHSLSVTGLEFSKHGRSLLSLGADSSARVSRLKKFEWKEWQLYAMLLGMIAFSGLLFLLFFQSSLSDDFWQFPMGREQPARPPREAIWGHPGSLDESYGL